MVNPGRCCLSLGEESPSRSPPQSLWYQGAQVWSTLWSEPFPSLTHCHGGLDAFCLQWVCCRPQGRRLPGWRSEEEPPSCVWAELTGGHELRPGSRREAWESGLGSPSDPAKCLIWLCFESLQEEGGEESPGPERPRGGVLGRGRSPQGRERKRGSWALDT